MLKSLSVESDIVSELPAIIHNDWVYSETGILLCVVRTGDGRSLCTFESSEDSDGSSSIAVKIRTACCDGTCP